MLAGELYIAAVPHMRDAVHAARRHADRIVVDLRDVTFLDGFALHALTALHGSDFEVVDVSSLMVDPDSGQALP